MDDDTSSTSSSSEEEEIESEEDEPFVEEEPKIAKKNELPSESEGFDEEFRRHWALYTENTALFVLVQGFVLLNLAPVLFGSPNLGFLILIPIVLHFFPGLYRITASFLPLPKVPSKSQDVVARNPLQDAAGTSTSPSPTSAKDGEEVEGDKKEEKGASSSDGRFVLSFRVPTRFPSGSHPCMHLWGLSSGVANVAAAVIAGFAFFTWLVDFAVTTYTPDEAFASPGFIFIALSTSLILVAFGVEFGVWVWVALAGGGGLKSMGKHLARTASKHLKERVGLESHRSITRKPSQPKVAGGEVIEPSKEDDELAPLALRKEEGEGGEGEGGEGGEEVAVERHKSKPVFPLERVPATLDIRVYPEGGFCCCFCGCEGCYKRSPWRPRRGAHLRTHADGMQLLLTTMLIFNLIISATQFGDLFLFQGLAIFGIIILMTLPVYIAWLLTVAYDRSHPCQYQPNACGGNCALALTPIYRKLPAEAEVDLARDRVARLLAASVPLPDKRKESQRAPEVARVVARRRSSVFAVAKVARSRRKSSIVPPSASSGSSGAGAGSIALTPGSGAMGGDDSTVATIFAPAPVKEAGIDELGDCNCLCRDGCAQDCYMATLIVFWICALVLSIGLLITVGVVENLSENSYTIITYLSPVFGVLHSAIGYISYCSIRRTFRAVTIRNWRYRAIKALAEGRAVLGPRVRVEAAPSSAFPGSVVAREVIFDRGVITEDSSAPGHIGGNPASVHTSSNAAETENDEELAYARFNDPHPIGDRWWRVFVVPDSCDPLVSAPTVRDNVPVI